MQLSVRESQIVALLLRGMGNKHMAKELGISPHTAQGHVCRLLRLYGVETRTALVAQLAGNLGVQQGGFERERRGAGGDRRSRSAGRPQPLKLVV